MNTALLLGFEASRFLLRALLLYLAIEMVRMVLRSRHPRAVPSPPPLTPPYPFVTVQLPIRDEGALASRVLNAAVALRWPRDVLSIQVLDDSSDPNTLRDECARWVTRGEPVQYLHRPDHSGGKGANLDFGLTHTNAEILAIFDADFIPPPTFLEDTVPHLLADTRRAAVQRRWTFENEDTNLLTRAQSLMLTGLMALEQVDRSQRGVPHHFNGSAGVWRRQGVVEGGGWRSPSSTEDLDLSMRVLTKGWSIYMLPGPGVPSRLPDTMAVWRRQFARWSEGKSGALVHTGPAILRAQLPWDHKVGMFSTLLGRILCLGLTLTTITLPLTSLNLLEPWVNYSLASNAALMAGIGISLTAFYARALSLVGQSPHRALWLTPMVMALMVGSSLLGTVAYLRGFWRKNPPSERTPKSSIPDLEFPLLALAEAAIGGVYLVISIVLFSRGLVWQGLFFIFWGLSYGWVGLASLWSDEPTEEFSEHSQVLSSVPTQTKSQHL